ncbi:MAG: ATP-binding protein [Spirochaetes bacterium]|nr:ATP-binding protein [Spirochaetota bacterium]
MEALISFELISVSLSMHDRRIVVYNTKNNGGIMQELQKDKEQRGNLLTHIMEIEEILEQAEGLNDLFFEFAKPHLDYLAEHLQISHTGAALFAVLTAAFEDEHLCISSLAERLRLKRLKVMGYMDELEILEQKGLINIKYEGRHRERLTFDLDIKTIEALRKGNFHDLSHDKNLSIEKFFFQLKRFFRESDCRSYESVLNKMKSLLNSNTHLLFVQKVQKLELFAHDTLILLYIFHSTVNDDDPEVQLRYIANLFEDYHDFDFFIKPALKSGDHALLRGNIIEHSCSEGFGDTSSFCLTQTAKDDFLAELDIAAQNLPVKELKPVAAIAEKTLFYPEKTKLAIEELHSLLQVENFDNVQKRLSDSGMRTGFACLFSGGPGTGKTETVYQVARLTGRDIMHVDIASIKSKWFGESEKEIKAVFDKYRNAVKKCGITPILLFNEADAIFAKRRILDEKREGPGQTENAIQNIILQEMENLSGILIATTNMTKNLDAAFERRFLYKIEFERPEAQIRKAIWSSLLPGISDDDALTLASRFDFSGGQIENIARKSTIHSVLTGKTPLLEHLIQFCSAESVNAENVKPIGFASTGTGLPGV